MKYRWKKIVVNQAKQKHVIVRLYNNKKDMQDFYAKFKPNEKSYHYQVEGLHAPYVKQKEVHGNWADNIRESGTVLLHVNSCGAGVVSHELMHAVLWAVNHPNVKRQHPIIIKNMKQEEELLHDLSNAVSSFYDWFYSVTTTTKKGKREVSA